MTREEIEARIIPALNKAQENYIKAILSNDKDLKRYWSEEFRKNSMEVISSGFRLKSSKWYDLNHKFHFTWSIRVKRNKASKDLLCPYVYTNMRPEGEKTLKGDCTTRALSYCLKGIMSYAEILKEQYALADRANELEGKHFGDGRWHEHRNSNGIWDRVMTSRGYVWVITKTRRNIATIASYLGDNVTSPCIVSTRGHATIIHNGALRDTFDCRGYKVLGLLVSKDDENKIKQILSENGIVIDEKKNSIASDPFEDEEI